ncbi:PAS domain S-box protein [Spirosoma sp. KCTC 42546]|uniref:sensor histidine kinase n=1 Tax=Spirosoma sp. KCTC 42546 TaxID=2520506 RepID=UPI0011597BCB|nr:PAS domain-containing sensor histidine kinase [Spirosoma sp. KCTC 42546]QDK77164.1 PAS domain S-box protein [Spirosoma sp. KCTC 42546]
MAVSSTPPNQDQGAENERLRFALQAAGIGTWDLNFRTQVAWWDQRTQELYGFAGTDVRDFKSPEQLMQYVHADDQQRVQKAMQWALNPESGGHYEIEYRIIRQDDTQIRWLLAKGQAYFDEQGRAYRFSGTAQDITQQVLTRQLTEEAQEGLQSAIELAQLGTWHYDLITGHIEYSSRLRAWHGIGPTEPITTELAFRLVRLEDWALVRTSMQQAISGGSDGHYDVEYRVSDSNGAERILHSHGKAYVNQAGQAYKISGMVQDVTPQRRAQFALEQQVTQRTQQLEISNEDLRRSNENLQQFAYIASHDLQEPLRKIQQFGDLLKTRYASSEGDELVYLERMQSAASRMSTLIRDLLSFSRISTHRDTSAPISLDTIVQTVLLDLDLMIAESEASVVVGKLPTLEGDRLQLQQLVRNLLSNALKFRRPEVASLIEVSASWVAFENLPASVSPKRPALAYHRLDVTDNGIGFDEKYLDRIFQVFQRLHGKNEFAGTGVGLAICEKVVSNHGGAITATSQPGLGTTFSAYFPV